MVLLVGALVLVVACAVAAGLFARARFRKIIVQPYERGFLYIGGQYHSSLAPGQYWIWTPSRIVTKVDLRSRVAAVPPARLATRHRKSSGHSSTSAQKSRTGHGGRSRPHSLPPSPSSGHRRAI